MRINKLLSNLGYCSRREANRWIEDGRLTVNGQICQLGQWLEDADEVLLDEQALVPKDKIYMLLNKPVGITCTAEATTPDNIIGFLNFPEYIFPVGRLDKNSEGLMLLTNDGELANQVLAAEHGHEKVYHVTVNRPFDAQFLEAMGQGVEIDGQKTKPCRLQRLEENQFQIILSQGLNRQIRKMCLVFGFKVLKLKRIRILNLELGALPIGQWRMLDASELQTLREELANTNLQQ